MERFEASVLWRWGFRSGVGLVCGVWCGVVRGSSIRVLEGRGRMATEVVEEATEKKWWDWVNANGTRSSVSDNAPTEAKRAYFDDLVSRCVLVKALSPLVTHQILAVAIDQFATVLAVKFLRNPMSEAKPSSSGVVPNHSG